MPSKNLLEPKQESRKVNIKNNNDSDYLSDIEVINDDDRKNDFKYQLRRRLHEMKIKRKCNQDKKNDETDKSFDKVDKSHVVIELEKQISKNNVSCWKNKFKSTTKDPIDNLVLKDFVEKYFFMPQTREFSKDEENIIEAWRLYLKNEKKMKKRENRRYFLNKFLIGFGTVFLLFSLAIFGTAFIIYNMFSILNSIKENN